MQPSFKKSGAAIHPIVFSIKAKQEKLEVRIKKLEDEISNANKETIRLQPELVLSEEQNGHRVV